MLTHVGQSSEKIGLMNRRERAKRRGYSSSNITLLLLSLSVGPARICTPLGEGETGRSVGGTSKKDFKEEILKTKHLLIGWVVSIFDTFKTSSNFPAVYGITSTQLQIKFRLTVLLSGGLAIDEYFE